MYVSTYMHVYVYVFIYIRLCTCTHLCISIYMCTYTHTHIHIYICIYMYIFTQKICVNTFIHICLFFTSVYICTNPHAHTRTHTHTHMKTHTHTHIYIHKHRSTITHTHTLTHTQTPILCSYDSKHFLHNTNASCFTYHLHRTSMGFECVQQDASHGVVCASCEWLCECI